jgi:hypothetical protein
VDGHGDVVDGLAVVAGDQKKENATTVKTRMMAALQILHS